MLNNLQIANGIAVALEEKKGEEITVLDISQVSSFSDYFIICNGTSDRMLKSLSDTVIETSKRSFSVNGRLEGRPENGWVLVDLGDIIVHLFSPDQRDYYQLEELWSNAKVVLKLK
jgi:ribosome-associated protein